jgi:hypothetical protein
LRLVGYLWAFPITLLGLILAALSVITGGSVHIRKGIVEVHGGLATRLLRGTIFGRGGAAMALGHVILARDAGCLERSRRHELVHVRQYECWGVFLPPVYWLISFWLSWRGYHPYLDHPFEPPPE